MTVTDPRRPTRSRRVPVISVGNLAMGGRGKTPTVAAIARLLVEAGERPSILSRGYRRRRPEEGVVIVSDGRHLRADVDRSGDEPLMLARQVPGAAVLVCDVRAQAAALAETVLGVTVHLLDDGFQHRSLKRDLDLVIVDREDLRGRRLPFGKLRSSPSTLDRAHAVLVDGASVDDLGPALDRVCSPARTARFSIARALGDPWLLEPSMPGLTRDQPVVALAGIAAPERFRQALEHEGWRVARLVSFRDHHVFTRADLDRVRDVIRETGAQAILTTEKDAMRLLPLRPLACVIAAMPLTVTVEPADTFRAWLLDQLRGVRA